MPAQSESSKLPTRHPHGTEAVASAFDALYNWNYEPEIDQLRTLYANALDRQWIALRDLDWERDIDREAFARTFSIGGVPIQETRFWENLDPELRWTVSRKSAAFMLSNFLHGEQGALMVAGQLVSCVPHMDGKFYAATQTLDEARHVEVFAAYVKKLDDVHEIAPGLKGLLDSVLATPSWTLKAVGMQVVTEGLALYSFRDMRNRTSEPLLKQLLTLVARDEARHTGYGIKYLNAVVPTLSREERDEIEDFAFEAARLLVDPRTENSMRHSVLELWRSVGIDPAEAVKEIMADRERMMEAVQRQGVRFGPMRGFVIPTLKAIGLYSDRIRGHFDDMFQSGSAGAGQRPEAELPEDLEVWVEQGAEAV